MGVGFGIAVSPRTSSALAALGPLFLLASPALAATPEQLCSASAAANAPEISAGNLTQATRAAEAILARRSPGADADTALAQLKLPEAPQAIVADPAALAAYCAAAGESMRVATSGSQYQAQTYLLAAIRYSEQAKAGDIAARAAYRLGLASAAGEAASGAGGTRGARRAATDPAEAAQEMREAPPGAPDACGALLAPGFLGRSGQAVTRAALTCANSRASTASPEIAALAGLRLARLSLAGIEKFPPAADALRADAGLSAFSALDAASRIRAPALRAELLGRLAEAALDAGFAADPRLARAVAAMRAAAPQDHAALAFAAALTGRLALAAGDAAAASAALQQAVFIESQRPQPLRLSDWLLLLAQAEPQRRELHLTQAYRALESVRPLLPLVDPITEESIFTLRMRPVFQAAVEVQLGPGSGTNETVRIAAAQQIIETFRQAEIQSAFGSNCVPPRDPVRPEYLRAGEVLLYPILLKDRVELIYTSGNAGGAPSYRRLPASGSASREAIGLLVNALVDATSAGGSEDWQEPSRQLYDLLIKPIEAELGPNKTLVIVPDGPLRALPFAALTDADGKFLIEKTRLSIAPALSYSQPGLDRSERGLSVVAASLEQEVRLPSAIFPKLENAADEARAAASVGTGGHIKDFRKADLSRALSRGRVDILHLATHAAFNGRSDRSFIVANDEAIPMSELRGLIGGNRTRGDELDLLVLSACETAVGDDQASMGLAGAAVQAGARSAIASLWQVADAGTVELMKQFYANYRAGESKAEALRNAQVALITKGGDFADPNIWAAFTLLGGWR